MASKVASQSAEQLLPFNVYKRYSTRRTRYKDNGDYGPIKVLAASEVDAINKVNNNDFYDGSEKSLEILDRYYDNIPYAYRAELAEEKYYRLEINGKGFAWFIKQLTDEASEKLEAGEISELDYDKLYACLELIVKTQSNRAYNVRIPKNIISGTKFAYTEETFKKLKRLKAPGTNKKLLDVLQDKLFEVNPDYKLEIKEITPNTIRYIDQDQIQYESLCNEDYFPSNYLINYLGNI